MPGCSLEERPGIGPWGQRAPEPPGEAFVATPRLDWRGVGSADGMASVVAGAGRKRAFAGATLRAKKRELCWTGVQSQS